MGKYLCISSYIRKPFPHICLCNCFTLNFLVYEENLNFFLSVQGGFRHMITQHPLTVCRDICKEQTIVSDPVQQLTCSQGRLNVVLASRDAGCSLCHMERQYIMHLKINIQYKTLGGKTYTYVSMCPTFFTVQEIMLKVLTFYATVQNEKVPEKMTL